MTRSPAVRPDDIRRHNLSLLMGQVHRDGALTRAELTQRLGLSRSTIGALVAELTELGLVDELVPSGGMRAGRPSHVVGPHPAGPYVIAVDLDIRGVSLAAVGVGGAVLARHRVETDGATQPVEMAKRIAATVAAMRRRHGDGARLVGLGVAVPGTVDRHRGVVGVAPNLGWRGVPFAELLTRALRAQVPVWVGNDADLSVLAEHVRGAGRDCDELVFLIGRAGVGAGLFVNGVPVRGHDGHAGEIGHNVIDPAGPACHCGKHGCLETFVSDSALLSLAGRRGAVSREAVSAVFDAARHGRERPLGAVRTVAGSLGQAIAGLVNTLNPERVILGGSFAEVYDIAPEQVQHALARHVLDAPGETVDLSRPALGEDSALLGAAEIAFSPLLADPLVLREWGRHPVVAVP